MIPFDPRGMDICQPGINEGFLIPQICLHMGFLPSPYELWQVMQIAPFDISSLDLFEIYENLHISYTFAPRRWQVTQIAPFNVRSLEPFDTSENLHIS